MANLLELVKSKEKIFTLEDWKDGFLKDAIPDNSLVCNKVIRYIILSFDSISIITMMNGKKKVFWGLARFTRQIKKEDYDSPWRYHKNNSESEE